MELETNRLNIFPLDLGSLQLLKKGRTIMENHLGLEPSNMKLSPGTRKELKEAIDQWIKNVSSHEKEYWWFTNWEIILKAANKTIGGIGFAGQPNERGTVHIGFMIDENYEGNGYMTECLGAMIQWAFSQDNCEAIRAVTPLDNIGSHKVLEKNNFVQVDETPEAAYIWELKKA